MVFIDVFSRYAFPFYIKERKEAPKCLKEFIAYAERQSGEKILAIRTDNAKEFVHGEFNQILRQTEIEHQTTAPYSSASNGIGERVFRTIQENGLTALHGAKFSIGLWPEAFDYIIHMRNRSLHSGINNVPYKLWKGDSPSVSNAHPFGCHVQYLLHPATRRKGDFHARSGRFVGYYEDSPAYKIWNPETRQFVKTRSVAFEDLPMSSPPPLATYNARDFDENPAPMESFNGSADAFDNPMTRPLSPLTDIEEVEEPLPSVQNNVSQPQQTHLKNISPSETDRLGYKIRPEQNPNHPDFANYGRSGGRSQRVKKPVDKAYSSEFTDLFGRMKDARDGGSIEDVYASMNALISHYDTYEKSQLEGNSLDEEDYAAMLAGFNVKSRTLTHREVFGLPAGFRKEEAIKAIKAEVQQIEWKKVWERVQRPPFMQTFLDVQYIVTEKFDAYGQYIKTKARMVVRGDKQEEGKDYDETHTHTPSMGLFRFTLALIHALGLKPRQLDVVGAFLEAPVQMDVYIRTPPMVECPDGMVLKLQRALYGMRQAPREFGEHRDKQLRRIGYRNTLVAPSLFFRFTEDKKAKHGIFTDLGLWWVDDDLGAFEERADGTRADECVAEIGRVMEIEDKGVPNSFLGFAMKWNPENGIITIYQPGLIDQIVKTARLEDSKDKLTPMKPFSSIPKNTGTPHPPFQGVSFAAFVGAIGYLVNSRPDLAYTLRVLASHASNPSKRAWEALNHAIAYIKTTRDWVLTYGLQPPFTLQEPIQPPSSSRRKDTQSDIVVFSDADWATEAGRHSISGFISFFRGCPINWASKKQPVVALSSMESEVIAANLAVKEGAWMRKVILALDSNCEAVVNVAVDNQAAIYFAQADTDHTRSKHIDTRYYYVKEKVQDGTIRLYHVPSENNAADLFTKPFRPDRHLKLMRLCGLRRIEEVC
jgi:hypothetical protein